MQFLKILFWCLLAFVAALFTYGNWDTVPIHLWSSLIADVNLPLLLLTVFLLGLLPTLIYQHAVRWRLRQRLAAAERTIEGLRPTASTASIAVVSADADGAAPAIATGEATSAAPPLINPDPAP